MAKIITTSETLRLKELFYAGYVKIIANGADFKYVNVRSGNYTEVDSWVQRDAEVTDASSAVPTPDAEGAVVAYTVTDGSQFRIGEIVSVASSGDVFKGSGRIVAKDATTIQMSFHLNTNWTAEVGDKFVGLPDNSLADGWSLTIATKDFPYLKIFGSGTLDTEILSNVGILGKE